MAGPYKQELASHMGDRRRDERPPDSDLVKVQIPLLGGARESGFESEAVWAEPLGNGRYRVWNLPVFAYNLDMRAVVRCEPDPQGGLPRAVEVLEPGDCYVVRLFFSEAASEAEIDRVLRLLSESRALFEKCNNRLWAVGLRSVEDYEALGAMLQPFVDQGVLQLESGLQSDQPTLGGAG